LCWAAAKKRMPASLILWPSCHTREVAIAPATEGTGVVAAGRYRDVPKQ
jgi:ribosomal protein S5